MSSPRANDNNEAAPLLADENQLIQSNILPKDVWNHLLQFCSLESIGRLAQVDRNLSRIVKNANLKKEFEAKVMLMVDAQLKPGYVKGSYANLKAFFAARQRDELRTEELNQSCCINDPDACLHVGVLGTVLFTASGGLGVGLTSLMYFAGGGMQSALLIAAVSAGPIGLFSFGPVALCIARSARRRNEERTNLTTQLQAEPVNLHGTLFSWQPTNPAANQEPARLKMN
jgi:hypothetical protein